MTRPGHRRGEPGPLSVALLTVSDTRTSSTDVSGATARRLLEAAGHCVFDYAVLPDEPDQVRAWVRARLSEGGCDGVIVTGGTGISRRDSTHEAITALLEKTLDGFGELFRMLSYAEVGSAAMLSRATGGVVAGRFVFSLPGSPAAVTLALERLVLPEIGHLVAELRKHPPP